MFNEPTGQNLSEEHQKYTITALMQSSLWHV